MTQCICLLFLQVRNWITMYVINENEYYIMNPLLNNAIT